MNVGGGTGRGGKIRVVLKRIERQTADRHQELTMRTMSIPAFPDRIEIADIAAFTNARLAAEFKSSEQGSALAGYMFYPASETARASFWVALRSIPEPLRLNLKGMARIQYRWLRATDVLHI